MGDDLGFLRVVAQQGQEIAAEAHEEPYSWLIGAGEPFAAIAYFGAG
jgi:hypothetical protein